MIELEDISLTYRGRQGPVEALRGIDLHIAPGEKDGLKIQIVGPNAGPQKNGGPERRA